MVVFLGSACSNDVVGSPAASRSTSTTSSTSTTTTTTEPRSEPFAGSVNDFVTMFNIQLPLLIEDETPKPIPLEISADGTFGSQVTADTEIRIITDGSAFEPVSAVVVRTQGTGGSVSTPARLLSGVGATLHTMSADAVTAFGEDVLPQLSAIDQTRTTITVGSFYDLTIVVVDSNRLTYIFTPIGVAPAADLM